MEIRKMNSAQGLKQGAKQLFLLSVFFILSITLSGLASGQAVHENCSLNCVENEAGKVLTSSVMNSGDGSIETFSKTYNTAAGLVIVTTYIYYDADGNIIDVKVVTTRFSKPMEK